MAVTEMQPAPTLRVASPASAIKASLAMGSTVKVKSKNYYDTVSECYVAPLNM